MKKYFLLILSLFTVFALCSCQKGTINDEKIKNYAYQYTVTKTEGENSTIVKYTVNKEGYKYQVVEGEGEEATKTYYLSTNSVTYEFTTVTIEEVGSEYNTVKLSTSDTDDKDVFAMTLDNKAKALSSLSFDTLEKNGKVYNFKEVSKNSFISAFLDDSIKFDAVTEVKGAFDAGLLVPTKAELTVGGSKVKSLDVDFEYNGSKINVNVKFSSYGSKIENFPQEGTKDKKYYEGYYTNDAPIVTVSFGEYGNVEFAIFDCEGRNSEYINYVIYMIKDKKYEDATVNSVTATEKTSSVKSSHGIVFGDLSLGTSYIDGPTSSDSINNTRGIVSVPFKYDSKNSSALIINYSDSTSYDSNSYYTLGGVISGFEVLDLISALSETEYQDIEVGVSIKLNGFNYVKPVLKDAE